MALGYRDAGVDDLPAVDALLAPFVQRELLLPRTPDELRSLMKHAFLAELDGAVIGFSAVEIYSRKLAEIQCLAVDDRYQGRGIGADLVRHCIARARREGVLELMAISSSDGFLIKCGFDYSLPYQKRALFFRPQE